MPLNEPIHYMLCISQGQSFFEASLTCKPKIIHVSHPADKQEKDTPTDLVPVNLLLEVKKLLNAINTLPKGVVPHIKKFLQEDFSFQTMQREVAANNQNREEVVPALTLRFLITRLEAALRNIHATNYTAHQINIGYYLTLLFLYGVALTERGKKEDYIEAENKFLVMKMVIQENEICENFMSLVYFGRGSLRCAQKRYNGGLLEFHKSLQEIGDTDDHWFDIDPTEDEDLPTTFKDLLKNFIKTTESNIMKQTICSYLDCERSCEADILKNTNYKGFFQLMCSKSCCVYFHKICWKKFKNLKYPGENDQSFSGKKCLKEGCTGDMVRMLQCEVPGIVKILVSNFLFYKKLMSLKITDTDKRPKISLKFGTKDEMPIFKLDYNYFYHLLHIIIVSGTDIVRQIFDEALPPPLLRKELLIHKNVLEPYYNHLWTNHPLGGAWHLLYPPNKELPQSRQFDLYLLLALIKHLNVFPAPTKGWNMEPPPSDLSKSADILRLCKYRDILLSEILMNGLTEPQFTSIWKKVSDILLRLGMKKEDIDKVKENPIENISLDYHQLSLYLGIPVPEIIQRMLSCYQQGIALQSITGSQRIEVEELQNEEEELSPPLMEYNINVKSIPEIQLAEMNKDVASIPSESSTESIKDLQEVKSKSKKKKKTKNKKSNFLVQSKVEKNSFFLPNFIPYSEELTLEVEKEGKADGIEGKNMAGNKLFKVGVLSKGELLRCFFIGYTPFKVTIQYWLHSLCYIIYPLERLYPVVTGFLRKLCTVFRSGHTSFHPHQSHLFTSAFLSHALQDRSKKLVLQFMSKIFWPGELHGLYSPWGHKESDMTERLSLTSQLDSFDEFGKSHLKTSGRIHLSRCMFFTFEPPRIPPKLEKCLNSGCHSFLSKERTSFNLMPALTVPSAVIFEPKKIMFCSILTASSFRILNSSAEIMSPPLALFLPQSAPGLVFTDCIELLHLCCKKHNYAISSMLKFTVSLQKKHTASYDCHIFLSPFQLKYIKKIKSSNLLTNKWLLESARCPSKCTFVDRRKSCVKR
ncbi:hypothetical protein FD754_019778 [Muntiacus muntjak]|uniref:Uncharacterized protein n=1 Tax=Muntiacus muntjak TaxID=9888 RepID=A0A5N3V132_MUNMU|nr:hypothetical protein FD754_019778 [Muntiacus muntjak]